MYTYLSLFFHIMPIQNYTYTVTLRVLNVCSRALIYLYLVCFSKVFNANKCSKIKNDNQIGTNFNNKLNFWRNKNAANRR